MNVKVSKK